MMTKKSFKIDWGKTEDVHSAFVSKVFIIVYLKIKKKDNAAIKDL